jgi:hypothetical protein
MHALAVSAQFAAYTWFKGCDPARPAAEEDALRFARSHWPEFLPCARAGLGRLLLRLAAGRGPASGAGRPARRRRRRGRPAGVRAASA